MWLDGGCKRPHRCYSSVAAKRRSRCNANIVLTKRLIGEGKMAESVYKVVELVGTSTESWEKAAKAAVERAAKTLKDLRIAEVIQTDIQLKNGKVEAYRARVKLSFKYRDKD
jgi:dodecin